LFLTCIALQRVALFHFQLCGKARAFALRRQNRRLPQKWQDSSAQRKEIAGFSGISGGANQTLHRPSDDFPTNVMTLKASVTFPHVLNEE
jgi:hypothetical protein